MDEVVVLNVPPVDCELIEERRFLNGTTCRTVHHVRVKYPIKDTAPSEYSASDDGDCA